MTLKRGHSNLRAGKRMFSGRQAEKHGNRAVERDGHWFHSRLEESVYLLLKLREKAGEIKILQCQDVVYLTLARIRYEPDFKCLDLRTNEEFWCEAKGFENDRWPMKKKLWKYYGPGPLEIWKGTHVRPALKEIIVPAKEET